MKKILAAAVLALALMISHACQATEISAPTQPPPFTPSQPHSPPAATPGPDLDQLMRLFKDDDEKPKAPELKCEKHPCVFGYRFSGSVDDDAKDKFQAFMNAAKAAGADTVMLEINTPGGSADEGHEMSRIIENAPITVACVVDGKAASMGMYLLQSCDVRVMTKRSYLMVHQVAFIVRGGARITQSSADDMREHLGVATRGYVEWVAHRMKVSVKDILAKIDRGGEWFISWEEALKVGAVDKVISDPPEAYFQQLKAGKH